MTERDLIRHKYREYDPRGHNYADKLFQKCFRYKHGPKKFYLNIYYYAPKTWPNGTQSPGGFLAEANFYLCDQHKSWIELTIHDAKKWSVKRIEKFFNDFYQRNLCLPDIHNQ
jgi:hypothetical protein